MQKYATPIRRVNAVLAALLAVFFLAHACAGSLFENGVIAHEPPVVLIYLFVGIGALHIALCIVTSYLMLTDDVRPPSKRKKNHLLLKWVAGVILLALALAHMLMPQGSGAPLLVVLLGVLAWHIYIGCKSLVRDLSLPKKIKRALYVVVIGVASMIAVIAVASVL